MAKRRSAALLMPRRKAAAAEEELEAAARDLLGIGSISDGRNLGLHALPSTKWWQMMSLRHAANVLFKRDTTSPLR